LFKRLLGEVSDYRVYFGYAEQPFLINHTSIFEECMHELVQLMLKVSIVST